MNVDRTENEVSYTKGEYLPAERIREAFGLKEPMPPPSGVAPSQPNPFTNTSTWKWTGLWALVLVALFLGVNLRSANETVLEEEVRLDATMQSGTPSAMHFSQPFEIHRRGNVRVEVRSPVVNTWMGVQGDLVDEASGEVVSFYDEVGYYSGNDSDGAWSEGSQDEDEYLSSVAPGRYVLRTTANFEGLPTGKSYTVKLVSDSPRGLFFFFALVLLLIGPVLASLRSSGFESRRWADSNLGSD